MNDLVSSDNYWFAERDSDGYDPRWQWQPTLQGSGFCLSLPVHFATKQECEQFIRDEVIGADADPAKEEA